MREPAQIVEAATALGVTVGVAESLTAGAVCARIADVPGASLMLAGGLVVYATRLKHELLGVNAHLLATHGPVHEDVARQMALGCRRVLSCDIGLATTGVAGPGPADGHPPGTVHIAAAWASGHEGHDAVSTAHRRLTLGGDRASVRAGTVAAVVDLLGDVLDAWTATGTDRPPSTFST